VQILFFYLFALHLSHAAGVFHHNPCPCLPFSIHLHFSHAITPTSFLPPLHRHPIPPAIPHSHPLPVYIPPVPVPSVTFFPVRMPSSQANCHPTVFPQFYVLPAHSPMPI
jgi:hypothetical protein